MSVAVAIRMVVILVASLLLSGLVNAMSPTGISWSGRDSFSIASKASKQGITLVDLKRMQSLVQDGTWLIIDARPELQYTAGHLPGALSVPRADMDSVFVDLQILLTKDQPVVVYCAGQSCDDSVAVATFLKQQGLDQVAVFEGGMTEWSEAKLDVEKGK